jgi:hypothetical protein
MRNFHPSEIREQFLRAGQRPDLVNEALVRSLMEPLDAPGLLSTHLSPGFSHQRMHEQPSAHADLPVNTPDRKLDSGLLEGFPPRQHVLVDVIDQRPV